jgi:hypothetical protein
MGIKVRGNPGKKISSPWRHDIFKRFHMSGLHATPRWSYY